MKRKKLFVALVAVFSVLVFLGTFILIWFWGDEYKDFSDFSESVKIPGLDEGAVPQGLANYTTFIYDEAGNASDNKTMQEYFFISAYMKKKGAPSRIYVTGAQTGYVGYVTMQNEDGTDYTGHCGGIATSCVPNNGNGTLWITSESTVYCAKASSGQFPNIAEEVIAKARLYKDGNGGNAIKFSTSFNANCNADFCFYFDYDGNPTTQNRFEDRFYVGEFYRPGSSETAEGHHVTTESGAKNKAFVYEYYPDTPALPSKYGLKTLSESSVAAETLVPKIQYIYSVPDKIQGFARLSDSALNNAVKGKLVLSQSWGLANSSIYCYDFNDIRSNNNSEYYSVLMKNETGEAKQLEYAGVTTKSGARYYENPRVYFVDESLAEREYSIPSMSEGLCANGNKVYVLFESGSGKYKTFVRQQLKNLYYFIPRQ